ncbi:glycosyltransferase [bacterium]|nr:glycosyltransferase [bacterium]
MKLAAFLISFNRPEILRETIHQILQQTRPPDLLLVVDNGNSRETEKIVQNYSNRNVIYQAMEQNVGPAGASAYALTRLVAQGYEWIYWGDEDDPPEFPDIFERLMTIAENVEDDVAGIGAVGARFNWKIGESERLKDEQLVGIVEVDTIGGNSQLILRNRAVREAGLPDSRLFFGSYEPEYCLRVRRAGFRFLVDGQLMWKHREKKGRLKLKRTRSWISKYPSALIWRRYYRTRNYIFMMRKTFSRPDLARRETMKAIARTLFSWFRGIPYGAAFSRLQLLAVLDGYRGRMGRTVIARPKESDSLREELPA